MTGVYMNGRKWRGPVRSKARRPYGRRQWAHRHGASRRCGVEPVIAGVAANAPGLLQGVSSEWDSGSHPDAGARRCESREPRSVGNWCERGQPDSRRPIRIAICEGFSADTQRSRHASHNNVLEPGRDPPRTGRIRTGEAVASRWGRAALSCAQTSRKCRRSICTAQAVGRQKNTPSSG